jgi:hypothetical protein
MISHYFIKKIPLKEGFIPLSLHEIAKEIPEEYFWDGLESITYTELSIIVSLPCSKKSTSDPSRSLNWEAGLKGITGGA